MDVPVRKLQLTPAPRFFAEDPPKLIRPTFSPFDWYFATIYAKAIRNFSPPSTIRPDLSAIVLAISAACPEKVLETTPEDREFLRKNGVKSAIMHTARRNKLLRYWQKNLQSPRIQAPIPHRATFGTLKRRFSSTKARHPRQSPGQAPAPIAFKLLKAANAHNAIKIPQVIDF
jgi:hypothetical protein